ncbi:hypothetical protein [Oceanirhabdus sp. W0125-5]|uniref:hypothetical protein n=1 Tax=Oceanirhabdus sp. W0125-5 TaxID=2999116 RepID=UPI0022F32DB9|nr:hypothetical protein [Oceanirhabdus sp. W0125-5]WBW98132.1 hypothetical protein OW730_05030 [Oceanirhabdus sp. W0125-5]
MKRDQIVNYDEFLEKKMRRQKSRKLQSEDKKSNKNKRMKNIKHSKNSFKNYASGDYDEDLYDEY